MRQKPLGGDERRASIGSDRRGHSKGVRYSLRVLTFLCQIHSANALYPPAWRSTFLVLRGRFPVLTFDPMPLRPLVSFGRPGFVRLSPGMAIPDEDEFEDDVSEDIGIDEDPFSVLRIHPASTVAEIKRAFGTRAKVLHPEVSELRPEESEMLFRALVEAYQEAVRIAGQPRPPRLDFPDGLSPLESVDWLVRSNKVMLFMHGTKQFPTTDASKEAVAMLSVTAFDTKQRFAAFNLDTDSDMLAAVLGKTRFPALPICFIDGELVGGNDEIERLYESGELRRSFGGADENPPCPDELLEWDGVMWQEPENWKELCKGMRLQRNPITARLQWVPANMKSDGVLEGECC